MLIVMLIEFRVENHRSIRDEQVFTMEAGRTSDEHAPHVRVIESHKTPLVTVAALYGANASGKSNLLSAFAYMCSAVKQSHRRWDPDGGVPRDPFAWGEKRRQPSLYEVTFVYGGVRYQYGFVVDDEAVLEEWLYAWRGRRQQMWFERDDGFKFGEKLKGENRLVAEVTRANALLLSVAAQHGHKQLGEVYKWFAEATLQNVKVSTADGVWKADLRSLHRLLEATQTRNGASAVSERVFVAQDDAPNTGEAVGGGLAHSPEHGLQRFLTAADVGITGVKVERGPLWGDEVSFLHGSEAAGAWLPLAQESAGTQALYKMAKPVLNALVRGSVLVVDELEQSLHPLLALYILRQFNDPQTNPKNAQLIFTTHDTNLLGTSLGEPSLARDQVWLTEKDESGGTAVYPLTDYKPRKAENIERGYLQGRYGGIPFLGQIEKLVE